MKPKRSLLSRALPAVLAAGALLLLAPAAPRAEDEKPAPAMSLGGVLEVAVRQDPTLELARIDAEIADARVYEASGIDDWVIDARLGWSSVQREEFNIDQQDIISAAVDVSKSLFTGGTVTIHGDWSYQNTTQTFEDITSERTVYTNEVNLQVTQPLLDGRGKKVARAGVRQAKLSRDAAVLQARATAVTTVRDVVIAYWELAFALRDVEIRRGSLELAQERLRITQAGIEGGAVAPTEALAVEQIIATREEEILRAEVNVAERALDVRRLAGLEIGPGHIDLQTTAPLAVEAEELSTEELLTVAYERNPDLAVLEVSAESAAVDVEVTDNGLLPSLDISASFGPQGAGDDPAEALERMARFGDFAFILGLNYQHIVRNRAARGSYRAARRNLTRAKITIADAKAQVASSLIRLIKRAESATQRMELSERAVELSKKNIEAEKARFELGRATNFDVLQRQDELKQAQLGYARAVVDYLSAIAAIDAITGDIFGKYGITIEKL